MFAFVKRRAFVVLIGLLLIAIFIWFAGPYFGFGSYHPLESELARLIAIALVVAWWIVSALLKWLRARQATEKLVTAVLSTSRREKEQPSAEAVKLRERFEEAVATLKQRRSGQQLYDLPWYVFIGAPGSGKTTALLNSGLKFPLEQRVGKGGGARRRRHAQLRLVVHRRSGVSRHRRPLHDPGLRRGLRQRRLEGISRASEPSTASAARSTASSSRSARRT